jgi:hypothetical protein
MDPWLEDPAQWPDVHTRLINALSDLLVPKVRPRYAVRIEERVYVDGDEGSEPELVALGADVSLEVRPRGGRRLARRGKVRARRRGAIEPVEVPTLIGGSVTLRHLKVVTAKGHEVVAVIELLSPTNKRGPASAGRREYVAKRDVVLRSAAHLVEVDLLRAGQRVPMLRPLPPAEYYAILSRAGRRPRCEVWPIGLRDQLPTIDLPLRGDESVPLDLQAALDLVYDRAGYDAQLDYDAAPVPPLSRADAAWARGRVAAWRR